LSGNEGLERAPGPLRRSDLSPDPLEQFQRWFVEARKSGEREPEAMALATADASGRPSCRWVLLKGLDRRGFVFYTNRMSRKGAELESNPRAALAFRWSILDRQVRVVGEVSLVGEEESDAYFASRPRLSQLGAWASAQSQPLADRASLEAAVAEVEARFAGAEVPRPPWWAGYRVAASELEFWQQGQGRLHDRFRYLRRAGSWEIDRLSP